MSKTAQRTDPKLWEKVKSKVTRGGKGGDPGQWSARKAQLAVQEYKKLGGGYLGAKSDDNSPKRWSDDDLGTKSGRNSREPGARDLPKKPRKALADDRDTSAKTRVDMKKGKQASHQPKEAEEKTARNHATAKAKLPKQKKDELLTQARYLDIEGRSNMLKSELLDAIRLAKH